MSVRAYKIIEIKTEEDSTFNCCHEQWILDLASNINRYYCDGGFLEFDKEDVEEKIAELNSLKKDGHNFLCRATGNTYKEKENEEYEPIEDSIKTLKNILKDFGKDDSSIQYECY